MLAIGLFVTLVSLRYVWRASALLRATPVSRIEDAADGALVRVSGTVEATGETVSAPFSGIDCVALRTTVTERRLGSYLLPTDVTIHEPTQSVDFAVRTPHAAVPIDAPRRTVSLDRVTVATVAPDDSPPERIAQYVRETPEISAEPWSLPAPVSSLARALSLGRRRYNEHRACPGDDVTVVGRVDGGSVSPLVVATDTPMRALVGTATTSLAGLLVGVVGLALGCWLVVAG